MTILSIAIPTYNRLDCLASTLSKMESFAEVEGLKINYCISASACNDGTQDYLSKISENKNNFKINIKRSKRTRWNWIYLKNLIPVDTDWVWLFGDDDIIIHPQGWLPIYKLIQNANNNDADIISIPPSNRINKEEIHIDTLINLSARFGLHEVLGWMTSIIMRRSIFINFLNSMQKRFKNVYTDRGLLTTKASPFLHSLIILNQNANCNVIFALQNIVDEQINTSQKAAYSLNTRNSEFLRERLPFTFSEYKELIALHEATKNISFFRYVNKTFFDLFINIISENILKNKKLEYIKNEVDELLYLYNGLNKKSKNRLDDKVVELVKYIYSSDTMMQENKSRIISIFYETKKGYLGNFIGEELYKS